jgi:hypothetical protein
MARTIDLNPVELMATVEVATSLGIVLPFARHAANRVWPDLHRDTAPISGGLRTDTKRAILHVGQALSLLDQASWDLTEGLKFGAHDFGEDTVALVTRLREGVQDLKSPLAAANEALDTILAGAGDNKAATVRSKRRDAKIQLREALGEFRADSRDVLRIVEAAQQTYRSAALSEPAVVALQVRATTLVSNNGTNNGINNVRRLSMLIV